MKCTRVPAYKLHAAVVRPGTSLERHVTVFLPRVFLLLGGECLQVKTESAACCTRIQDVIHVTWQTATTTNGTTTPWHVTTTNLTMTTTTTTTPWHVTTTNLTMTTTTTTTPWHVTTTNMTMTTTTTTNSRTTTTTINTLKSLLQILVQLLQKQNQQQHCQQLLDSVQRCL